MTAPEDQAEEVRATTALEAVVSQIVHHETEAARHKAAADRLKHQVRELVNVGEELRAGPFTVRVTPPNRRFNEARFMADYPIERNPDLYRHALDPTAIPAKYKDQYMDPGTGESKVTIK